MDLDLRTFVQVVERGSFTSAADGVGLTPSAVSKSITRLEDRLGTRLFHRTTRKLALTTEGEQFYLRARDIVAAIEEAEADVRATGTPKGALRINCVTGFALHELSQHIPEFLERYPGIDIQINVTDRIVDLLEENVDLAIRTGTLENESLIARKIKTFQRRLYASPEYLSRRGIPQTPSDLKDHRCIVMGGRPPHHWVFRVNGEIVKQPVSGRILVSNIEAALRIAIDHGGIVRLADFAARSAVARSALEQGALVPVLADFHAESEVPIYAVYPQGKYISSKTRVFIDFLVEKFGR